MPCARRLRISVVGQLVRIIVWLQRGNNRWFPSANAIQRIVPIKSRNSWDQTPPVQTWPQPPLHLCGLKPTVSAQVYDHVRDD